MMVAENCCGFAQALAPRTIIKRRLGRNFCGLCQIPNQKALWHE
jgi:hypothetical protein